VNFLASIWYLFRRGNAADAVAVIRLNRSRFLHYCSDNGSAVGASGVGHLVTWDARLTSTLLLWLIYVSYFDLAPLFHRGQTPVLAAALAIFGFRRRAVCVFIDSLFRTQTRSR